MNDALNRLLVIVSVISGTLWPLNGLAATVVGSAPYKASSTGAGNSYAPTFSADGKHVAFVSHANNLVTNDDLAPHLDLFVRDLVASNTVLVSVSSSGFGGGNDNIGLYTHSSNAQVVAFETTANNLAPDDTNRWRDIYLRDLVGGITRLITPGANNHSSNPLISEDGQRVIFESLASNLVTNDFNGTNDIFIHDVATGLTELVSVNADGTASPAGPSHSPSISADGLTVAFVSHATNLVVATAIIYNGTNLLPVVTNELGEVYVREIRKNSNIWAVASHVHSAREFVGPPVYQRYQPSSPQLSRDGRYVAFKTTTAAVRFDLSEPPTNILQYFPSATPAYFAFQKNPRVVPVVSPGYLSNQGMANSPLLLTPDGRYLVYSFSTNKSVPTSVLWVDFETFLTNATSCCDGGRPVVTTNVTSPVLLVSTNLMVPHLGSQPRQPSIAEGLSVSSDGQRVSLMAGISPVPNLALLGVSGSIYVREITNNFAAPMTTNLAGLPGQDLASVSPSISADGSFIAWDSPDDNIVLDDLNRAWDIFVRNVDTGETQVASVPHPNLPAATGRAMSAIAGRQSISGNGSQIVVLTRDSILTEADTNLLTDAVLRDLQAQTNVAVSGPFIAPIHVGSPIVRMLGATNEVFASSVSADGRYVMFAGRAFDASGPNPSRTLLNWTNIYRRDLALNTNDYLSYSFGAAASDMSLSRDGQLVGFSARFDFVGFELNVPEQEVRSGNSLSDLFVRSYRMHPWRTTLMSTSTKSVYTNSRPVIYAANGPSISPVFSPDSRWVVFQSLATDLTYDPDPASGYQLYAREIDSMFLKRISYDSVLETNVYSLVGGAANPVFSADARFVFFEGITDRTIYRHDLLNDMNDAGTARRLNLEVCVGCANPSSSADGRLVAYETRPESGSVTNILLKDLEIGSAGLISVSLSGTNGNGSSFSPLMSHDARFVVFASRASDLVAGDNNRATDIFVRDRWVGVTHCLSRNFGGTGTGNRVSSNPILSADGRTVAFQSFASDLVPGDYNDTRDVFVVTLGGPDGDGDGMEDDWEMACFNALERDGSGDFDADGASDLDEFRAGTNPANNISILRVLRLSTGLAEGSSSARTTVILWQATPGRTYRVEAKEDLNSPWEQVGEQVVAASTTASIGHAQNASDDSSHAYRFYRVVMVQ